MEITINPSRCSKCGACVSICPIKIFDQKEKGAIPEIINNEWCIGCGQCLAACPTNAISHEKISLNSLKSLDLGKMPTAEQVMELIQSRRSIRAFKEKPVEKEKLEKIIEAARLAPSAKNLQTTEYIVVEDKALLAKITDLTVDHYAKLATKIRNPLFQMLGRVLAPKKLEGGLKLLPVFDNLVNALKAGWDPILWRASAVILFHAKKSTIFSNENANLALQNAALMAHALGLGAFYTGYVVVAAQKGTWISKAVDLPDGHMIFGGLAVGYPKAKLLKRVERRDAVVTWK